jgi:hypothetical protein
MKPSSTSSRWSIFSIRWVERRIRTSRRWSSQARSTSFIEQTLGVRPSISTFMLSEKRTSRSELRKSIPISISGSTVRARGSSTMRTSSALSSRTSARIGTFLIWMSSASRSISFDFCTW